MKKLYFLVFAILACSSIINAQCEAPELISWNYPNDSTLIIGFNASEGIINYEMEFTTLMVDVSYETFNPITHYVSGLVSEGGNTVILNSAENGFAFGGSYFSAVINGVCDEDTVASDEFYISRMSILNEIGCPDIRVLNTLIPDIVDYSFDTSFLVEEGDSPLQIDQFSIFIDLTHSYMGDLDIKLTSPSGTTIDLISYPNGFGGNYNMSVLFKTGFPELEETLFNDGLPTVRGTYAPDESFDAFIGEILSGTWTISVTDNLAADWGVLCGACLIVESSPCEASAQGKIYYDYNNNGIQEELEPPFTNHIITTSQENTMISNSNGEFVNCFNPGDLSVITEYTPLYHDLYPVEGYSLTLVEGDHIQDLNFRLVPIPGMNDVVVNVYSTIPDVPGFERNYYVGINNVGTECIDNIDLTFTSPEGVDILLVNDATDAINSPQEFVLNIGTLCPQESALVQTSVSIGEDVEVGSTNSYTASLSSTSADETPENNSFILESAVVSSYDPNDKTVDFETVYVGFMEEEKRLTYTVRFQNDGTFYAQNVVIRDMIEEGLILESFELLDASHDVVPEFNGRELSLNFEGIQLPQSDLGLEESQGYVRFSFLPTESFSLDETIENTAAIYFDFNDPIITNTAITLYDEVEIVDSVLELENGEILIYPNPTEEYITVNVNGKFSNSSVRILDLTGRTLIDNSSEESKIDVTSLEAGVFLIRITSETGKTITSSFIKR